MDATWRRVTEHRIAATALLLLVVACGASGRQGFGDEASGGDGDRPTPGDGDRPGPDDARDAAPGVIVGDGGTKPANDCSDAARLVYLASAQAELWSFWPPSLELRRIGALSCDATSSPFSMAVDRRGTAYVLYKNGRLFAVSTVDARCTPTAFSPANPQQQQFGMGFSTGGPGGAESLYVATVDGSAGTLDLKTFALSVIGPFKGATRGFAELTGTGDGRLYGFFLGTPASLHEVEKSTASTGPAAPIGNLSTGTSFAFSFWGGDFWFYTADSRNAARPHSDITRFRPSDQSVQVMKSQIGFRIVGAGVSTCAPVQPPK